MSKPATPDFATLLPLLEKLDTSGPRYTSYPTAPRFSEAFGWTDWEASLAANRKMRTATDPLSLYTHLPFCLTRCHFCGCNTIITEDKGLVAPYLVALLKEIELMAGRVDAGRPVAQFHLGGGTPNYLTPAQLSELMSAFQSHYCFAPGAELAVELDPRTVTTSHLDMLHAAGFNRYSLGVQDFDPTVQEVINRHQSREQTEWTIQSLRERGQEAINLDLIYGLPQQTIGTFADTLQTVLHLRPSRIALYSYAHVPWKSPAQRRFGELPRLEGPAKFELFLHAWEALRAAGYVAIGFDHFALPEDELVLAQQEQSLHRNFMGYTTQRGTDVLAHGVSAISDLGTTYAQNVKKLPDYYHAIEQGALPVHRGYRLTREDELRRELILDLTCNFVLDIPAFESRWGIDFVGHFARETADLQPLVADGLLTLAPGRLEVTPIGRFFVRNICMVFDAYLPRQGRERQFSRTL